MNIKNRNGLKILSGWLAAWIALSSGAGVAAAAPMDGVYQDLGPGYSGELKVTVTVRNGVIETLQVENRSDQQDDYLQTALDGLSSALTGQSSVEGVDVVSGATKSSQGILEGVKGALEQAGAAAGASAATGNAAGAPGTAQAPRMTPRPTMDPAKAEVFSGLGSKANFRVGPGKDDSGVQVYSFNVTMANVLFDQEGRILDVQVDVYEVSTPNYDGKSMPNFSGWPGRQGYNMTDKETGKVTGESVNTEETISKEVDGWVTKRERGADYGMNPNNEWYMQMDAYEGWMIGKTTAELRQWFDRYTSKRNGRPIKQNSDNEDDIKALEGMNEEDLSQLADVASMATMSLSDSHGLILEAIEKAYENRTPVEGVARP